MLSVRQYNFSVGIQWSLKARSNSQKVRLPAENVKLRKPLHHNAIHQRQEINRGSARSARRALSSCMAGAMWTCSLNALVLTPRKHSKRQATQHDCLLCDGDKWIENSVWRWKKNILYWARLEKQRQDKNLLYRHDKLKTNQPRKDPFHLNSLGPHSAQFQQSAGATPHYSLSVPSTSLRRGSRWAWGLRTEKGKKNLYLRFKLCAKNLVFSLW